MASPSHPETPAHPPSRSTHSSHITSTSSPPSPTAISSSPKPKIKTFLSVLYTSLYTFLLLLLLLLLLATPADAIRQTIEHGQFYKVIIIGVAYVATVLVVSFVYAARLFMTRNVLASIPREGGWGVGWCDGGGWKTAKGWGSAWSGGAAAAKGGRGRSTQIEVKREVAVMIKTSLSRNAAIAWDAKPRVKEREPGSRGELDSSGTEQQHMNGNGDRRGSRPGSAHIVGLLGRNMTTLAHPDRNAARVGTGDTRVVGTGSHVQDKEAPRKSFQIARPRKTITMEESLGISLPPHHPVWGSISHPGWSSPNSPDLPNLQYSTVLSELPNLIEAKALTLAPAIPTDDGFGQDGDAEARVAEAQAALQRQGEYVGLRDYLAMLTQLGVLQGEETEQLVTDFVSAYERARFSTSSIAEPNFRTLMHLFAALLRAMQPLAGWGDIPGGCGYGYDPDGRLRESDSDPDDPPAKSLSPTTPRSQRSLASMRSSIRSQPSGPFLRRGSCLRSGSVDGGCHSDTDSFGPARLSLATRTSSMLTRGGAATVYRTAPTTPMSMKAKLGPPTGPRNYLSPGSALAVSGLGAGGGWSDSDSSFAQTRRAFEDSTGDEHEGGRHICALGSGTGSRDGRLRSFAGAGSGSGDNFSGIRPEGGDETGILGGFNGGSSVAGSVRRGRPGLGIAGLGSLKSQRGEIASGSGSGSGRSGSAGSASGRSAKTTGRGSSGGSVIRLARAGEGDLPYVLKVGERG
ncbi:sucrase/ferredoxin domain-containing protein [Zalerion maritima]|uniref:Defect at low temperature protein 1 n=1 Tax=Zalerion maritima TaxID=339359 RepID=A0AAD5RKU4_9PEZI|nr:sucrase/ferredoxin domain-containing protein [Zalerion maritima]